MRLFYAAYLSHDNMTAYQRLVDKLIRDAPRTLRSVPLRTHHLTLAFLGEIGQTEVPKCLELLDVVESFEAFAFSLGSPSILMGRGRPRLIRIDVTTGLERVQEVQAALTASVGEHLPNLDEIRFKPPHVTIARFNKNAHKTEARSVERALSHAAVPLPETDRFSSACLVKSSLTPSGPIYETLREVFLSS